MFLKNCFAILTFTSNKRFLENVFVNWQIITFCSDHTCYCYSLSALGTGNDPDIRYKWRISL